MRHTFVLPVILISTLLPSVSARAIDNAHDLASYCEQLERGARGKGRDIRIPNTKEAQQCWAYMQAIQNMSVLVDENGNRLIGSCPPEETTLLQLIHSFVLFARSHPAQLQGNTAV